MSSDVRKLTFEEVTGMVKARRWWCALIMCVVVAAGVLFAYLSPKVYKAEALLAPNREVAAELGSGSMLGSLGNLASLSGLLEPGEALTNEALATLRSRAFLEKFIQEENLLPVLYWKDWDPARRDWNPNLRKVPTLSRAWKKFRDDVLRIEEVRGKGLYIVSVEWTDRKLPAAWLNMLVNRLNRVMRDREMTEAQGVLKYLRTQVEQTDSVEIRNSLYKLTESQLRRGAMASVREDYAFRVIDPPFISDADQFVYPRRVFIVALSILLGAVLAIVMAMVAPRREPQ